MDIFKKNTHSTSSVHTFLVKVIYHGTFRRFPGRRYGEKNNLKTEGGSRRHSSLCQSPRMNDEANKTLKVII
jgi:hypothetical protein